MNTPYLCWANPGKFANMNIEPTKRQDEVLDFIKWHISDKGWAPTYREICEKLGFGSTAAAHNHLLALEKKGYVKLGNSKARAIKVTNAGYVRNTAKR